MSHSKGIHSVQGIHKAFTSHSQDITHHFRTRHSQGIHKNCKNFENFQKQIAQGIHKAFTSHSQGIHETFTRHSNFLWVPTHVLSTGIHKAFIRHSQDIPHHFRTRHSQGIYKSFTRHYTSCLQ